MLGAVDEEDCGEKDFSLFTDREDYIRSLDLSSLHGLRANKARFLKIRAAPH